MWAPAATLLGCTGQARVSAAADVTVTVACWAIVTVPTVADIVLAGAAVELSVPVATPFVPVGPDGCVRVLLSPAPAGVPALFLMTLPYGARAVTGIVLGTAPVDALIVAGAATTPVRDASTAPGSVKAVKLRADPTPVACAVCVLSVGVIDVPSVQLVEAMPLEFVLELSGLTEPPPSSTDQLMVTPATGLLRASATRTDSGTGSVCPTVSVCCCPPLIAICVAPPTWAVTLNVTGVRPAALALVVCVPGVGPSVRVVDACPEASVTDEVGFTEPPPDAAAQVTVTLFTGLPCESVTSTVCGVASVVPTGPTWLSPENFARLAAGPAVPVAVKVTGLPERPAAAAVSVLVPAVVPRVQLPTVAMPLAFVVCSAPVMLPPPDAGANVTPTPCTGLLLASRTITDGGVRTAVPVVACCPSPPFGPIWVATPAVTLTAADVTLSSPAA